MTARKRRRQSTRQERETATQLGGTRVPGSGSGDEKADGRVLKLYRIENKGTVGSTYRIYHQEWDKLWIQAVSAGEKPVFHVKLHRDNPTSPEFVVLETCFVEELFGECLAPPSPDVPRSLLVQANQNSWPKINETQIPYNRYFLRPVRRRRPHDVTLLPWSHVKDILRDYSH